MLGLSEHTSLARLAAPHGLAPRGDRAAGGQSFGYSDTEKTNADEGKPRKEVINHPGCREVVNHRAVLPRFARRALCRTRTDDPFLTMEVLYQLS